MEAQRFRDKVVAVTGAASGIGRAILTGFVREGARGVLVDIDQEWAEMVASGLRDEGCEVLVSNADVTKSDQVEAMLQALLQAYGRLDVFVNNAGVGVHKEVVDLSEDEWRYQVDAQLHAPFLCCRAAARQMIAQGGGGRIINIGSTAASNARVQAAPHCVSKAGVVMLTKVLALELGKHNITVNCVSPGLTDIRSTSRHGGATPEYTAVFVNQVPLARLGRPEEIASAVMYLASEEARFITGQHLTVDGGYSAGKLAIRGPHRGE